MASAVESHKLIYVLRYRPPVNNTSAEPLLLSGYGVELWIKKTDYKVIDDRKVQFPGGDSVPEIEGQDDEPEAERTEAIEVDERPVIMKLEEAQVKDLALKAADYILASKDPLRSLVHLSQNFPRLAHNLVDRPFPQALFDEVAGAQMTTKVVQGFSGLWINGLDVGADDINMFKLLRFLRAEGRVLSQITSLGFDAATALELLNVKTGGSTGGPAWGDSFDTRDDHAIIWLNDLEKDRRYAAWPRSLRDLLRPGFPNQLKYIRRNLFSLIMVLDLAKPAHLDVLGVFFTWISREVPLRLGVVLMFDGKKLDSDSNKAGLFAKFLVDYYGLKQFREFAQKLQESILEGDILPLGAVDLAVATVFDDVKVTGKPKQTAGEPPATWKAALDSEVGYMHIAIRYMDRMGIAKAEGAWFLNGRMGDIAGGWQDEMVETYFRQLEHLQRKIYYQEIDENINAFEHFSTLPGVLPRRNPYISSPTANKPARFVDIDAVSLQLPYLTSVDPAEGGFPAVTMWLVSDFADSSSWQAVSSVLRFLAQDGRKATRVGLVPLSSGKSAPIASLFNLVAAKAEAGNAAAAQIAESILNELIEGVAKPDVAYFSKQLADVATKDEVAGLFKPLQGTDAAELRAVYGMQPGESVLVVNGRIFGPFPASDFSLSKEDYDLASLTAYQAGVEWIAVQVGKAMPDIRDHAKADAILRVATIVSNEESAKELESGFQQQAKVRAGIIPFEFHTNSAQFSVGDPDRAIFRVFAVVDPATTVAQRLSAVLEALTQLGDLVHLTVRLNPTRDLKDVPVKRFYRFVTERDLDQNSAVAQFHRLPEDTLLSLDLDVPNAWLAMPLASVHDLDNIKLGDLPPGERTQGIDSVFELTKILVEGHCIDAKSKQPPRGLQFILGSSSYPNLVDTIVMANLGYFQLKAGPGVWQLRLRPGRSRSLYELGLVTEDAREFSLFTGGVTLPVSSVTVRSFEGLTLFVKVTKKPGKENLDLLDEDDKHGNDEDEGDENAGNGGMWGAIKKGLGLGRKATEEGEDSAKGSRSNETTINVFSVASGHLYERFMSIMFIGVMRHTKSPVKFWLIENFMSPTFKDFLPHLAKKYGFQYELVTYKWPHWLRAQTEKQRTIWGYKILFLDVLFPLSLDRVIFVDADQIVRTDLKELMEMDIHGAPYAYTPFCNSRQETEGYRFWKSGYWANHLAGRAYHISALYLVDLKRFRQMAAGDRLRGQYQMLSADPESLANLDQDLPNNLIHQVPIFSLPQEWLWCETWCDDESLKTAKTIDLVSRTISQFTALRLLIGPNSMLSATIR